MDYSVKVLLPKKERNEYVTTLHIKNIGENIDVKAMAMNEVKRRPWLRLSDIEITKLIFEVKTLT